MGYIRGMQTDDLSKLDSTAHMLTWFTDDPATALRRQFETWLTTQSPGSVLQWLVVVQEPDWLTGGRRQHDDPSKVIVVRSGFAFPFRLRVRAGSGAEHTLTGVFSWVRWGLDTDTPTQRVWFDLDGTLETFGNEGALRDRLYADRKPPVPNSAPNR